ncbi:MAG: DUF1579 domain-containing protein [Opitutaceae bacterium]|nr:DUF1579 domain-containing protein [Verrucomicrobiales bacterium]
MKRTIDDTGSTAVLDRPEKKSSSGKSDADKAEMMKKMEAAGTPGPAHKALEAFIGNWKAEVKCWCEPGGAPQVSQGTAKASWILNGHFLEQEFRGEMMGKPFIGRSLMGYDNTKQAFNTVWISDMQTSMLTSEGKGENGNKVITLEGKSDCPATGQKDISIKTVFRVISPDKHVFEMFNDGAKSMEITYTRK